MKTAKPGMRFGFLTAATHFLCHPELVEGQLLSDVDLRRSLDKLGMTAKATTLPMRSRIR
jgi:hypothetical protein